MSGETAGCKIELFVEASKLVEYRVNIVPTLHPWEDVNYKSTSALPSVTMGGPEWNFVVEYVHVALEYIPK